MCPGSQKRPHARMDQRNNPDTSWLVENSSKYSFCSATHQPRRPSVLGLQAETPSCGQRRPWRGGFLMAPPVPQRNLRLVALRILVALEWSTRREVGLGALSASL